MAILIKMKVSRYLELNCNDDSLIPLSFSSFCISEMFSLVRNRSIFSTSKLFSLYGHWVKCNGILELTKHELANHKYDLKKFQIERDIEELVPIFNSFNCLTVAYGLLYVVIEGYTELELKDAEIDELLMKNEG